MCFTKFPMAETLTALASKDLVITVDFFVTIGLEPPVTA